MFQRFSGFAVLVALVGSLVAISPSLVSAQGGNPNTNRLDVPISGVVAGVGTLTGNFAISRFVIENGQLTAVGTLTATSSRHRATHTFRRLPRLNKHPD
jgi:hypothetical protein